MRVLRVVNSNDGGGVFACEIQFINELKNRNVTVDAVIIGNGDKVSEYKRVCCRTYSIPALDVEYSGSLAKITHSIVRNYNYGSKYAKYLKSQIAPDTQYDIIMYQRPLYIHLVGNLARLLDIKSIWHLPCIIRSSFGKNYYNYFCKQYGIIQAANSIYTKGTLGTQCEHVVYPGYDRGRVLGGEPTFRNKLRLNEHDPVYGIAARMHRDKAQDIVVKAFMKSKIPDAGGHLLIAGGPLDSDFAQKVKELAGSLLHNQIHFLGEMKDMSEFYSSVDVVINGRRNVEPFGISVAEAMGAGKPVIAYKLGGPGEMIKDGINGWLVDSPTVQNYEEAFNLSMANKSKWPEMGEAAKEDSFEFTVERNVDVLMDIISSNKPKNSVVC